MKRIHRAAASIFAVLALGSAAHAVDGASGKAVPTRAPGESPIFGVKIPEGYRQWQLVAPSHRPDFDEFRAVLGNALAMRAYRAGSVRFPDGSILVKLAWRHVPSPEYPAAFVPGAASTVQVMVKDSKKYAKTGGWGFGRFTDGVPADEAQHQACFACHQAFVKDHDWVFTRYAR